MKNVVSRDPRKKIIAAALRLGVDAPANAKVTLVQEDDEFVYGNVMVWTRERSATYGKGYVGYYKPVGLSKVAKANIPELNQ